MQNVNWVGLVISKICTYIYVYIDIDVVSNKKIIA